MTELTAVQTAVQTVFPLVAKAIGGVFLLSIAAFWYSKR